MDAAIKRAKSITLGAQIGSGTYGRVFKATRADGRTVAVKKFNLQMILSGYAKNEVCLHRYLKHSHIIQFIEPYNGHGGIVMEFAEQGDLMHHMESIGTGIPWLTRGIKLARDIASALTFLKSERILHLDVKLENILLTSLDTAKLTDFGLSIYLQPDEAYTDKVVGTPTSMAPEMVLEQKASFPADAYALGVTIYEFTTNSSMWTGVYTQDQYRIKQAAGSRPNLDAVDKDAAKLIADLWSQAPDARSPIEEISETLDARCKELNLTT